MKVLYVEDALDGHHIPYLKGLTSGDTYESVVITPEFNEEIQARQIVYKNIDFAKKSLKEYWKWICYIAEETRKNSYDVVHFLDGDSIMRFFGLGFFMIRSSKIVITYHGFYQGVLRTLSYRMMCANRIAVVHTSTILNNIRNAGVKTARMVEYPSFSYKKEQKISKNTVPVLGALGATRRGKGLDILLKALEQVKKPYCLLIAGQEADITREEINNAQKKLTGEIQCDLRFLSEEEFEHYLNMIDIFLIPYRREFNGASGPMVEGVARGKMIIGAEHGSIGQVIRDNHIGRTFESENVDDLARVIEASLGEDFVYDAVAQQYQSKLTVEGFQAGYYEIYNESNDEN